MNALFQLLSFLWAAFLFPPSLLLLFVADTWIGRAFAIAVLGVSVLPMLLSRGRASDRRRARRMAWAIAAAVGVLILILYVQAPPGRWAGTGRIQHVYSDNQAHFRRYALGNLLPEGDQLAFGFAAMTLVDPLLTVSQARDLTRLTSSIYRDLEADADFHALGSTMPEVYDDVLGLSFDRGHSYLYIPSTLDRSRPAPVFVFLHGYGGNFKAYLWVLSKLADRLKGVLIAPSNGVGNWSFPETESAVSKALAAAARYVALDPKAIHLAGLSNGGLGVSQLGGQSQAFRFRSLIFLSPVFDQVSLHKTSLFRDGKGCPIFVLTGGVDDRIPLYYVETSVEELKTVGAQVTLEVLPDANHFMIFSHQAKVLAALEKWLDGLRRE